LLETRLQFFVPLKFLNIEFSIILGSLVETKPINI